MSVDSKLFKHLGLFVYWAVSLAAIAQNRDVQLIRDSLNTTSIHSKGVLSAENAVAKMKRQYLIDHWVDCKGNISDSTIDAKISANIRELTNDVFNGRYFKTYGRNTSDFEYFKERIKKIKGLPNQASYIQMMDIAKAVCLNDTSLVESLVDDNVPGFSPEDQNILFEYFGAYLSKGDKKDFLPNETMRKIAQGSKNKDLVDFLMPYLKGQNLNFERYDAANLSGKFDQSAIIPFFHPNKAICYFNFTKAGEKSSFFTYQPAIGTQPVYNESIIDSLLLTMNIDTSFIFFNPSFNNDGLVANLLAGGGKSFVYHADNKTLTEEQPQSYKTVEWGLSPDKKTEIVEKDFNFFVRNLSDSTITQLTFDGEANAPYQLAFLKWLSNKGKFVVSKSDRRGIRQMSVVNSVDQNYPYSISYSAELPGDSVIEQTSLYFGDVNAATCKQLEVTKWKGQQLLVVNSDDVTDRLYFMRIKRTRKEVELCAINANGELSVLITEKCEPTFNDLMFSCKIINGGNDILFWSDRTGWGHYYLYDPNGHLKNALTSGSWTSGKIAAVDNRMKQIYFYGYGREKGSNPNFSFLYKVGFDGKNLMLLTPENANHNAFIHLQGNIIIDNFSRIDTVPLVVARNCSGKFLGTVVKPNIQPLLNYGWQFPEPFKVMAADNKTELYGIMWKPFNFDPTKKYPVISQVYPGPQTETVWSDFTVLDRYNNTALSQRGFIVVCMGHRGASPTRGREYASFGYGNLRDYPVADDKYGIEQLARRFNYIDSTRVGILGHSGGGLMTVVAMCTYPDFYKVGVASSGNYDNNIYDRYWGEFYQGIDDNNTFSVKTPMQISNKLKGHLLLVTGESDDNVNPSNTYRLVSSLINEGKKFDMLVLPGQGHHYEGNYELYFQRKKRDYFNDYLRQK